MEAPTEATWWFGEREGCDQNLEAIDGVTYKVVACRHPPTREGDDDVDALPSDEFLVDDPAGGHRHIAYGPEGRLVMNKPCFLPM